MSAKTEKTGTCRDEIATMMFGFGDNPKPDPETVKIVESVVLKQLREMLHEAGQRASDKSLKLINTDDIIFLLRHDKRKMQRFMKVLDFKKKCMALKTTNILMQPLKIKKSELDDFIESLDITGELMSVEDFDLVKQERALRAAATAAALSEEEYLEFNKARSVSFASNLNNKKELFRSWIDPDHQLDAEPDVFEFLAHMAYGIVGHLVEMALIIRQNSQRSYNEPTDMLTGKHYNSAMFNVPHPSRKKEDFVHISTGQLPISVNEMCEVVRRCYMPQVGYMRFSNKSMTARRKYFCI